MGMIKHSQSTQSSKFAISWNIIKKLGMLNIKVSTTWHYFILMEVARHNRSTQNWKLVIFLQYLKKKVSQLLFCSIVMQNIQIFYRSPVMFVVTLLSFHSMQGWTATARDGVTRKRERTGWKGYRRVG